MENDLIKRIEEDLRLQHKESLASDPKGLDNKWQFLISNEPKRFINPDLTINKNALRNFRHLKIFIPDEPSFEPSVFNIKNLISGGSRGMIKTLKTLLSILKEHNYDELLKKYPCPPAGNPYVFQYEGYRYTYRWTKHIYYLGLLEEVLGEKLKTKDSFTSLDIGSSYGIFSYLLKNEFKGSHHLLLDFPEQLVMAYYFLGTCFPDARIAGYKEISKLDSIDREFIENYDFVLIPWFLYNKLAPKSVDLVTNFASLGEMKREWFNYYLKSEPFLSTKYFFTVNHIRSYPTYDTDLTILDYPLNNFTKLHFATCHILSHAYFRKNIFFHQKYIFPPYFEFLGERNQV